MKIFHAITAAALLTSGIAGCSAADENAAVSAQSDEAGPPLLDEVSFDLDAAGVSLGASDAPVVLIEYASLTCGHCKDFHEQVMPRIKKDYVATGKVRFVFREFPTPPIELALAGFSTARCAGEEGYFDVLDSFFANQVEIFESARAGTVRQFLVDLAGTSGISETEFDACFQDNTIRRQIATSVETGQSEGVNSTPSLFLNGERLETSESRTPDGLAALIEAALASSEELN